MKYQSPNLWLDNNCPVCGHSAPSVYKPDLLKGPVEFECQSAQNPMRANNICFGEWGVAATQEEKENIKQLIKAAEELHGLYMRLHDLQKILGYKD